MKTGEEHRKNDKIMMEFGMQIARNCILKEINTGCKKNLIFSPLSLHIVLNMLASASTGQTLQQFHRFLESENVTDLNDQSSVFMELANSSGEDEGGPIISLANGIWVHHDFPMKHSFKQLVEDVYKANARSVDFVNKGKQVVDEINTWAREATKGNIDPLLSDDFFTKDAIASLASAIYFNGTWVQKFHALNTNDEDFHLLNGQKVRVPFMRNYSTKQFYGSFESFKLLKMGYKLNEGSNDKKYSMYVFLPHEKDGLQELVENFLHDPSFLLKNREVQEVELEKLWLPKLKYDNELNVMEAMKEVGLDLPFDPVRAEITEMVETRQVVYVSKAIQKSYIQVSEEGTIAAAVTIVELRPGALPRWIPPPPPRPSFVADHPFLFMIKEEISDIILFFGAALNPAINPIPPVIIKHKWYNLEM